MLARFLDFIHQTIGSIEHVGKAIGGILKPRNANAHGNRREVPKNGMDRILNLVACFCRGLKTYLGKHHSKFVPTKSSDYIGIAQGSRQCTANSFQRKIANLMPSGVV